MNRIEFHEGRCKGCGLCISVCPKAIIHFKEKVNKKGYQTVEVINQDACTSCTACALICPDTVITVYRPDKTA